jgi:hypothetical protein
VLRREVWQKLANDSPPGLGRQQAPVAVNFCQTTCPNTPESSDLHNCSRQNLKSHQVDIFYAILIPLRQRVLSRHIIIIIIIIIVVVVVVVVV